ncbi:hypothetical protein EYF80_055894 [Liparis tanakae]|uniref:Uncharacterized protein n=1 Tax=Liparis tanakae TaxID=230148 RepID=A0A4Z2EYU4_9TELE|nr:hypothetical protein EYF80_055894 [Liparis tanakae]
MKASGGDRLAVVATVVPTGDASLTPSVSHLDNQIKSAVKFSIDGLQHQELCGVDETTAVSAASYSSMRSNLQPRSGRTLTGSVSSRTLARYVMGLQSRVFPTSVHGRNMGPRSSPSSTSTEAWEKSGVFFTKSRWKPTGSLGLNRMVYSICPLGPSSMSFAPFFPQKPEKMVVPTGVSWRHNRVEEHQHLVLKSNTSTRPSRITDIKPLLSWTVCVSLP